MDQSTPSQTQINQLTQINLQDMLDNFGLGQMRRGRGLIERALWPPAQILARQVARLDQRVGQIGLSDAARELLMRYVHRLEIRGAEQVPPTGGALFVVNHPGMTDTLACFTSIPRADLRIVSNDRPFIRALPNIASRILFVSDQPNERMAIVRQVSRWLESGGAVMINPAGKIEPDPAVMPGALASLDEWSDSVGLFVRLAPHTVIIPMVVSGVIYAGALTHPLTRVRRAQLDRERVAATIQAFLSSTGYLKSRMNVLVQFGAPRRAADLIPLGTATAITRAITDAVKPLIEQSKSPALRVT